MSIKKSAIAVLMAVGLSVSAVSADTGVGVILGEPTGVSVLFNGRIAAAAAWSLDSYLHLHADYWIINDAFVDPLNWYLGLGGKVRLLGDGNDESVRVGARVPVGIQFWPGARLELFAEIVPGLEVIPDTGFDMDGGIGIRYHF